MSGCLRDRRRYRQLWRPRSAAAAAVARGADVVAVDVAPALVELARRLHAGLDVRQAYAEALPFRDADFDAAVSDFVALHPGRHDRAVAELIRVLGDEEELIAHRCGMTFRFFERAIQGRPMAQHPPLQARIRLAVGAGLAPPVCL